MLPHHVAVIAAKQPPPHHPCSGAQGGAADRGAAAAGLWIHLACPAGGLHTGGCTQLGSDAWVTANLSHTPRHAALGSSAPSMHQPNTTLPTEPQALPPCLQGKGSYGLLSAAWEEMRNTVRSWLDGRSKPPVQSATQLQASAARAVRAMHAALALPGGLPPGDAAADAALVQVPLESIVGGDSGAALQAVQQAIELEQRVVGARLAAAQGLAPSPSQAQPSEGGDPQQQQQQQQQAPDGRSPGDSQPLVGYFSSVAAGWCDSFDSGAPSDPAEQVGAGPGGWDAVLCHALWSGL